MKRIILICLPLILLAGACKNKKATDMQPENPFFAAFDTPYGVPAFDKIKNEHYLPAFKEGIKRHEQEIKAITDNKEAPDFENTILALDQSGEMLTTVSSVFFNLLSAVSSDSLQAIAKEVTPLVTDHQNNIMLNEDLFKRVKAVYDSRLEAGLSPDRIRVTEKYYNDFIRSGAALSAADKETLRTLNNELSMLDLQYGDNLLAETNVNFKLVVDKEADLAGLPADVIAGAAATAKDQGLEGKWVFQLSRASMTPFLQYAQNRDLREKIYRGYFMRGNNGNDNDNKKLITQMVEKRAKKAQLLGYKNYAEYVIAENMAETPENVDQFLMKLWKSALPVASQELKEMQAIANKEGANFKIASWDWFYYAEKLRKQKYNIDENELKPYFKLENVRDGVFWVATQLYGIQFNKVTNIPVYHPDVEVFEVKEADGTLIGILYMDYYVRDSKQGGAWCTGFREAGYDKDGKREIPLVSIVCNFPKPTADNPTLLSWDETTTLFHEFGHGLHGLFTDGYYKRTAGVTPRDYVELPSQIMENFASEPEVLRHYALHNKTNEPMPEELIQKLVNSGLFNQGFATVEYLAASLLDMKWHLIESGASVDDVLKFEEEAMNNIGLIPEILPRYRSTYFSHIFSGGYSAGYYVYIWAAVLDADAFAAFAESGDLFNKELAAKFRKYCLSEIGEAPAMEQYKKFRGQEPNEKYLLERRGLK
ncbi:MAG TPA: M3 family metallopeptidase [Prolixibacteraceae bacterium]|nr:M3 family metallopeptidase [Prolixibacteraceae bacterium]